MVMMLMERDRKLREGKPGNWITEAGCTGVIISPCVAWRAIAANTQKS